MAGYHSIRPQEPIRALFKTEEEFLRAKNIYHRRLREYEEDTRRNHTEAMIILSIGLAFGVVFLIGGLIILYIKSGLIPFIAILLFASLTLFIFKQLKE